MKSAIASRSVCIATLRHAHWRLSCRLDARPFASGARKPPQDPKQIKEDLDLCVDLVQKQDREGYLCGLLLPAHARKSYFAVRAFNAELASIKDGERVGRTISSAAAVKIRLQWWKAALDHLYPKETSSTYDNESATLTASYFLSPIVRTLGAAIEEKNLTRRFLERLIDARDEDLERSQMETVNDLIMYAEDTVAAPLYLSLECAGVREDKADVVAFHAGIGIGIVSAIRSFRHRAVSGEITIPRELLSMESYPSFYLEQRANPPIQDDDDENAATVIPKFKLNEEYEQVLRNAVQQMSLIASSHLNTARALQSHVPRKARSCLLPVIPSIHFLSKLERAKYDVWDPSLLDPSRLAVLALLSRTWLTGVF